MAATSAFASALGASKPARSSRRNPRLSPTLLSIRRFGNFRGFAQPVSSYVPPAESRGLYGCGKTLSDPIALKRPAGRPESSRGRSPGGGQGKGFRPARDWLNPSCTAKVVRRKKRERYKI